MEIRLYPFADGDVALLERWLQAEHVKPWFEHPADWLREVRGRNGEFSFIRHFIIRADGAPVGFCQYYSYRESGETWHGALPAEGTYSIDYMIGETAFLRRGCAREAVLRMVGLIAAEPDAERIIVQPDDGNAASRGTLLSAGFAYDASDRLFLLEL